MLPLAAPHRQVESPSGQWIPDLIQDNASIMIFKSLWVSNRFLDRLAPSLIRGKLALDRCRPMLLYCCVSITVVAFSLVLLKQTIISEHRVKLIVVILLTMALLLWIITVDAPILFQNTVDERDVEFQACLLTSVGWLRQIFSFCFSLFCRMCIHTRKKNATTNEKRKYELIRFPMVSGKSKIFSKQACGHSSDQRCRRPVSTKPIDGKQYNSTTTRTA